MTPRPSLSNNVWAAWLAGFPALPDYDEADLAWCRARLADCLADLPDPARLSPAERAAVAAWLHSWREDFAIDSEEKVRIVDPLAAFGLVSGLGGALAFVAAPLFAVGCFFAGAILLTGGTFNQLDHRDRREHSKAIRKQLNALLRNLNR